jgi:hypothetical protein
MKKFIRLSDEQWPFTEVDLDPLMTTPNRHFKPNEKEYAEPFPSVKPALENDLQKAIEVHPLFVGGRWTQQWDVVAMFSDTTEGDVVTTKAEHETAYLAKLEAESAAAAQAASKVEGIEILGVMCSATGKDQAGLSAVAVGAMRAEQAGQAFADTSFRFENGAVLTITPENFGAIEAIWTPFRQSFFSP